MLADQTVRRGRQPLDHSQYHPRVNARNIAPGRGRESARSCSSSTAMEAAGGDVELGVESSLPLNQ